MYIYISIYNATRDKQAFLQGCTPGEAEAVQWLSQVLSLSLFMTLELRFE